MPVMRDVRAYGLVLAMWACFAGLHLLWFSLDEQPPAWDDGWYLTGSLVLYDALWESGVAGFLRAFYTVLGFKAPLITALPVPFYLLFGRDWHAAYCVNLLAMLVLFVAVYGIGREWCHVRAGVLAVGIVATMPLLYGLSRWYLVEYGMTAMVAVLVWLLVRSPALKSARICVAIGVLCGAGLLLKASFPLYAAAPLGVALYRCARRDRAAFEIGMPALLVAGPWYAMNWWPTLRNAVAAGYGEVSTQAQGTGAIFSWQAIGGYLYLTARDGLSWYYTALLGAALLALAIRRPMTVRGDWQVLLTWLAPFPIFLFAGNKDLRYAAPLYPAVALLLAACVERYGGGRRWVMGAVTAVPVVAFLATSFQWPYPGQGHGYARRYQPNPWPHAAMVAAMAPVSAGTPKPMVLVGTDRSSFNANNIELNVRQQHAAIAVDTSAYDTRWEVLQQKMQQASFVAFKEGGERESPLFNRLAPELMHIVRASPDFELLYRSGRLPDGGTAFLYRRRPQTAYVPAGVGDADPLDADFEGRVHLMGLTAKRSGSLLEVKYGWRSVQPLEREYWCFTQIVNEGGKIIGFLDHRPLQGRPAIHEWRPGDVAFETLRRQTEEGPLKLRIGLYHMESGQRLKVTASSRRVTVIEDGTALELRL